MKLTRYTLITLFCLWCVSAGLFAQVNINSASAEQIALGLKGIGHKKAVAIVEYRKQHGPFKTLDSLTKVKGIGAKTVEKNKNLIKLGTAKTRKRSR